MDMQKIIQDLLDLAGGTHSAEEAESALLKAQMLMAKYHMEPGQAKIDDDSEAITVSLHTGKSKAPQWILRLAFIIAQNHSCFTYTQRGHQTELLVCGLTEDIKVVQAAFSLAKSAAGAGWNVFKLLEMAMHGRKAGTGDKNEYHIGFCEGLQKAYDAQVRSKSLVIVQSLPVKREKQKLNLCRVNVSSIKRGGADAHNRGLVDGIRHGNGGRRSLAIEG